MTASIDNNLIIQFSDMVHHAAQQGVSKLRPYCKVKQMTGDVWAYDGLGTVDAREVEGRMPDVVYDNIDHLRRKISRHRYTITLGIDSSDVRGALLDPGSEYAQSIAKGALRQYDRKIYNAAFAPVLTGRDFETSVTATDDGVLNVDATGGFTYEKLVEVAQNFIDNDVEGDKFFLTITGKEHSALMSEVELTSGDFTRELKIDGGRITNGVGMDFIRFGGLGSAPIIPVASSQRKLIAAAQDAICLGISKEMAITVIDDPAKVETTRVQVVFEIGTVRTEGKLLQSVTVTA